jgi:tetratricopeptide (TPR) repeat protein
VYKDALRLNPHLAGIHNNLGVAYFKQGLMDEAIEEYRAALRLNPDFADSHFNLALVYKEKGLKTYAIREFKEYLRLNPTDNEARKILEGLRSEINQSKS